MMGARRSSHSRLCRTLAATAVALALMTAGTAATATAEPAPGPAAWMFEPDAIVEVELGGLSAEELEKLETEKDEYQSGTFELRLGGAAQGPPLGEVGIRLKGGAGSFRPLSEKAAFKVKFNEYVKQKFFGLKKLTLNNMVQDPSMLHETLAYELFRSLGIPAPRTGYANVEVNGVNYGMHLNVETYDDVSLPRWFSSTNHLFEADEPGLDVSPGNEEEFEVDEGDEGPGNLADLEALITAANSGVGDWSDGMSAVADLDEMGRMWAVERYVGHWDGYAGVALPHVPPVRPNNYYLHSDDLGLFSMLPWGTDQTWGQDVEFDEPAGGLMFNRCFEDLSCKALYVEGLREALGSMMGLDLSSQASCLAELLAPWQALEDEDRREYDAAETEAGVEALTEFIAQRPQELTSWLATQPDGSDEVQATGTAAPCGSPEPEPESKSASGGSPGSAPAGNQIPPAVTPSGRGARHLRVEVDGGRLIAELRIDRPGLLSVIAKMATREGSRGACRAQARMTLPGKLSLSCLLSAAARRQLRNRELRLHVIVRFVPAVGKAEILRRTIDVPRLRRR